MLYTCLSMGTTTVSATSLRGPQHRYRTCTATTASTTQVRCFYCSYAVYIAAPVSTIVTSATQWSTSNTPTPLAGNFYYTPCCEVLFVASRNQKATVGRVKTCMPWCTLAMMCCSFNQQKEGLEAPVPFWLKWVSIGLLACGAGARMLQPPHATILSHSGRILANRNPSMPPFCLMFTDIEGNGREWSLIEGKIVA